MVANLKRLFVLALVIVLVCVSGNALAVTTLDKNTEFTVNGKTIKATDVEWKGNDGCWYYARDIYELIWGSADSYSNKFGSANNILKNLNNTERKVTVENIKYFIGKSKLGAAIRVCGCTPDCEEWGNDGLACGHKGHSMILVAKDSSSLTVVDNWGSAGVRAAKYTWDEFYSQFGAKKYTYFKYIKWPGASQIGAYQDYKTLDSIPRIAKSVKAKTNNTADDQCYLKTEPYEAGTTKSVAAMGEIIYLSGSVENKHGNQWYKTEDGCFVWKNDIEILEPNITNKSETAISLIGVSKNSDCYLKDKAYEAAAHSTTVAKGKTVEIVAKVVNYHGNTWYKTADGKYVYSGDVTVYENESTDLCTMEASFTNDKKADTHLLPYTDSPSVRSVSAGQVIYVKKFVVNKYNNIWAQLSDGSYRCFYDSSKDETYMSFVCLNNGFTETASKPTGHLTEGKSFSLTGTIKANAPLCKVTAYVLDYPSRTNALPSVSVKPGNLAYSVNLNKSYSGVNINSRVIFGDLPVGWFTYEVTAQVGFTFTYNNKKFLFGEETLAVYSKFAVGYPEEETLPDTGENDAVVPTNVTFSVGSNLKGTAGSTIVVPVSIQNPDAVALGVVSLKFDLPAGVTVSSVTACGGASGASVVVGNPTLLIDVSNGITGSGKILEVTLALDNSVVLPANVKITPTVNVLSSEAEYTLASFTATVANSSGRVPGDVTNDGKVSTADFLRLGKYLAGWENITINSSNSDVTGDGRVSTTDFLRLGKYLAGWDVVLE